MAHWLETGPSGRGVPRLVLAHGAGAAMTSPFMEQMAGLLGDRGIGVTRFEFGYMAERREGGKRRPPPRAELLIDEYIANLQEIASRSDPGHLYIGGKSMGGRVASLLADRMHSGSLIRGLVCLGYPFHPPGKPAQLRTAHLETLACPAIIVQGERDPFGSRVEVEAFALSPKIHFTWIPDGDHDFGPRGGSGHTRNGNLATAAEAIRIFISER